MQQPAEETLVEFDSTKLMGWAQELFAKYPDAFVLADSIRGKNLFLDRTVDDVKRMLMETKDMPTDAEALLVGVRAIAAKLTAKD